MNQKYKRAGLTILIAAVVFIGMAATAFAFEIIEYGQFWLEAEGQGKENYILLNWEDVGADWFYKIHQSNDEMTSWETRSANYGKAIKVLNIYPAASGSDGLQGWMNQFGQGLIEVDKVPLANFNSKPEDCLRNGSGEYDYDVIVFGFWDGYGNVDLSNAACLATEDYILSGRGVLFGHDTMRSTFANFTYLGTNYLNMEVETIQLIPGLGNTKIQSVQDGFLLEYPWEIPFGEEFTVPMSHTNGHIAHGTIWMNYVKPFTWTNNAAGDETIRGNGSSNFYLTTWNNTAMIQTGHTSGSSVEVEKKVLANVLMYLAQYTDGNQAEDHSGRDYAAPDQPEVTWGSTLTDLTISSRDQGTPYWYKIEAVYKHDIDMTKTSNTVKEYCTTGLFGYYIVEDDSDYLEFDVSLLTAVPAAADGTLAYTMSDIRNYLHIKAVDHAGNVSEALRISPYDLNGELTITKRLDAASAGDQSFIYKLEDRLEENAGILHTFYGDVMIPAGDLSADRSFSGLVPGVYTVTELEANWNYQLDSAYLQSQQISLLTPGSLTGTAEYKNNEQLTNLISGRDLVRNQLTGG